LTLPTCLFISGPFGVSGAPADGAQIFNRKIVGALRGAGVQVEPLGVTRARSLRLPVWQSRPPEPDIRDRIHANAKAGAQIILSHEAFFGIAQEIPVAMLIVHNYMPCFAFPGRPMLELCYHLGSRAYFGRAFAQARAIVFLSHRDHRHAVTDFPQIAVRSHVLSPPPHRAELGPRRDDVIHMSGSEAWLPKRLSRLSTDERAHIAAAGFRIEDFGQRPSPAFGLIPDRFTVGFKLKLMQMLYVGDAIASLSSIRDEVMALAPDYPWWREVTSVDEAVAWFSALRDDPAWRAQSAQPVRAQFPDWSAIAAELEGMLCLGTGQHSIPADGQKT